MPTTKEIRTIAIGYLLDNFFFYRVLDYIEEAEGLEGEEYWGTLTLKELGEDFREYYS